MRLQPPSPSYRVSSSPSTSAPAREHSTGNDLPAECSVLGTVTPPVAASPVVSPSTSVPLATLPQQAASLAVPPRDEVAAIVCAQQRSACAVAATRRRPTPSATETRRSEEDICRPAEAEFTIGVPMPPRGVACGVCGERVLAAGPTGFQGCQPVCDACLLEGAPELGMVLVLVAAARLFGALRLRRADHQLQALLELGALVRIYERYASRHAPTRGFESFLR